MELVRFALAVVYFLVSLLAVFEAPTNFLWKVKVAVTEWPHIFILFIIAPFIFPFWQSSWGRLSFLIAIPAFFLAVSPIIRAYIAAQKLPAALQATFGQQEMSYAPFSLVKLLAAPAPKEAKVETLLYSSVQGKDLYVDVYRPEKQDKPSPCMIVIHGGAWEGGDNKDFVKFNRYFCERGYAVAAITYRLAPSYISPAGVEDVLAAIHFLKEQSSVLGIDPTQFVLLGRSAGGQLAMVAAYSKADPSIKAVVAFYTPADLVWGYYLKSNPLVLNSKRILENYLGGPYEKVPQNYDKATALNYVTPQSPPTLMIHGLKDEMVAYGHNLRLKKLLDRDSVKNMVVDIPWGTHGCDYNFTGPGGQVSTYAVEYFLKSVVK